MGRFNPDQNPYNQNRFNYIPNRQIHDNRRPIPPPLYQPPVY